LNDGLEVVLQRAVKRLAGDALRHPPGEGEAERPQQQEGGEHPVQDFPEQAALFALKQPEGRQA
jgi:hypothetical protein